MGTVHKDILACYLYIITKHGYPPDAAKTIAHLREFKELGYQSIELEGIREEHLEGIYSRRLLIREAADAGADNPTAPLEELKAAVRQADILTNGSLDMLVRDDLVTPDMATSLMNDSAYAQHSAKHLIDMAECVFATQDVREPGGTP